MRGYRWFLAAWLAGVLGYEYLLLADAGSIPRGLGDGIVATAVLALPLVLLDRGRRGEGLPAWARPLGVGTALFLLAHLLRLAAWVPALDRARLVADVVAVLGTGLLLVGVALALRPRLARVRRWVALDGLAGALAGAAAVTWAVVPLVAGVWDGSWSAVLLLAAPLLDAALVAAALGSVGLTWPDQGHRFGLLAGGGVVLAVRDVTSAYQSAATGAHAAWLDGLVPLAMGMLALAAVGPVADSDQDRVPGRRSLAVPGVASVVAVAVLAGGPSLEATPVPTLLALLTCVVCGVRFVRAFLQLRELAVVREQALTDELTGIANRRALYQHLDELLPEDDEHPTEPPALGVALIDLDHFKEVNDTLGHAAGDGLLKAVVARFTAALAELDTPHLLARLGGDEFAVVLHEATSRNAAMIVGSALRESLTEPVELPEGILHAQASIGLALAPDHGRTRSEVLFAADAAMYEAKSSGSSVAFHSPARQASEQLTMAEELYRALERHELGVEYQPVVRPDGTIVAAEAFVRWDHPERGRLEAAQFLEAAGRYKLTAAIAKRVLEVALTDLARWRAGGIPLSVSVNLSAEDLRDESVVSTVASALIAHELPGEVLTIDISEADLAADLERVTAVVAALDEIGVRIAVDDYGVGGVPLADLVTLPLDEIKLDRGFTRDAAVSTRATAIVKSVLDLTHALGLRMVAEGVEDRRAHAVLKHLGCDLLQGRHLGRPVPAADFEERLFRPTGGKHRLPT